MSLRCNTILYYFDTAELTFINVLSNKNVLQDWNVDLRVSQIMDAQSQQVQKHAAGRIVVFYF